MFVNGCYSPVQTNFFGASPNYGQASVSKDFGGNITLNAGCGADQIDVNRAANGLYNVSVNGQSFMFTREEMSRLTIKGGSGNDRINVGPGVDVPVKVDGGRGSDTLTNWSNGAKIDGGSGNDRIFNASHGSTIQGGTGRDEIRSFGSGNNIQGGWGNDFITSNGNFNQVGGGFGHDRIGAVGYGNNVQGGFGWDRIGVLGGGNVANGGFGFDSVSAYGPGNACFGGPGFDAVRNLGALAFGLPPSLLLLGCRF
jgi:Ca2+-binding RTX toxin-like protein